MAGGLITLNPRAHAIRASEGASYPSTTGLAPEVHNTVFRHGAPRPEAGDELCQYLPDQPRSLVIDAVISGVRGAIVARFIDFRNLHGERYGD